MGEEGGRGAKVERGKRVIASVSAKIGGEDRVFGQITSGGSEPVPELDGKK